MILISFLTTRDSLLHKSIFVFSSLTSSKDKDRLKFDIHLRASFQSTNL